MTTDTVASPPQKELKREFTFRSTFSLAFAFISPIIGLYTIFALALSTAGPAFWMGFAVVLGGQLLVALVLAELASVWPLAGGLYKWTQRLSGARVGWAAGWAYIWTLIVLVTAQCYAAAPFLASLLGSDAPGTGALILLSGAILLLATGVNWLGPRALKLFVAISISAEILGSVVIGTILLLFFRELPISSVFGGAGGTGVALAPMLGAVALIGWSFIGFESAGDIAEEVEEPERAVPRALVLSLVVVALSISAEILGSVVIGTILLLFFRELPISSVFGGAGGTGVALAPMLGAVALIGWSFIGFESAGDIAEEVEEPERAVPRALVLSLVVVALIVMYAALGLILAVPDLGAAIAGGAADPISDTITAALGAGVATPLFVMVVLAFVAGIAAVQAAVSRVIFSLARDGELPAAGALSRLSGPDNLPRNALGTSAVAAAVFLLVTLSENAYATLLAMATVGFYISFAFPVMSALRTRLRGAWTPGVWNIGRLAFAVNVLAAGWLTFEIINIAWPRLPDAAWYVNYGALMVVALVAVSGVLVRGMMSRRGDAGAAIPEGVALEQGAQR